MCYSEKLIKEAGGYLIGSTWVVVGFKAIRTVEDFRMERTRKTCTKLRLSKDTGYKWVPVHDDELTHYDIYNRVVTGKRYVSLFTEAFQYRFNEVLMDGHGFHLAATEEAAKKAGADMATNILGNPWMMWSPNGVTPSVVEENVTVAICRVLARQSSITKDNHVKRLMLIEPGKGETMEQVYQVAGVKYRPTSKPDQVFGDPAFMAMV